MTIPFLPPPKPTDSELEILNILWELEDASVRQVHERLSLHKDSGYTTTLKLLQIMHEKKLVSRNDSQKVHRYQPLATRESTRRQLLHKMIDGLFSGSPTELVLQALGQDAIAGADLDRIQEMIDQMKIKPKS